MSPTGAGNILIVGATRGLGAELLKHYATQNQNQNGSGSGKGQVFGTTRHSSGPDDGPAGAQWATGVDLLSSDCGSKLAAALPAGLTFDLVLLTAGLFTKDSLEEPSWEEQLRMYTISCVAPVAVVGALRRGGHIASRAGGKLVIVGSESGSISLRHPKEGGGLYGHHASKAAANMVARLMALDLSGGDAGSDGSGGDKRDNPVAVAVVHPGFMRTEMTAGVGFDKFWDDGGAVTPDVAAKSLAAWIATELDMAKSGQYWAPRGPADIGTAESVLGKDLPTPLQLPW